MSEYVTDPGLLSQLNIPTADNGYVTDPELLKKLNQPGTSTDNSRYKDAGISTFAANAVNALTFGLPDYLNKTFTPETYAEGQRYQAANPLAANLGTATGEAAGYVVPAGYGAVKGAQLGARGAAALAQRFAPELGNFANLGKLYGKVQGGLTGATMGAQAGAALPGVVKGNPGEAVGAATVVDEFANKMPAINHLGGITGGIVPGIAAGAAGMSQELQNRIKMMMQYEAAKKAIGQGQ